MSNVTAVCVLFLGQYTAIFRIIFPYQYFKNFFQIKNTKSQQNYSQNSPIALRLLSFKKNANILKCIMYDAMTKYVNKINK